MAAEAEEEILSLGRARVVSAFRGATVCPAQGAMDLASALAASGDFRPRSAVERDPGRVQPIPAVVVRNASGAVLTLRRREADPGHPLHGSSVIWVGGHVAREDSVGGSPLLRCSVREVREELGLDIGPDRLRLLGAVYCDAGGGLSRHFAMVYEWRATVDDVRVAPNPAEFLVGGGSGPAALFVPVGSVRREAAGGGLSEAWSRNIARLLP